MDAAQSGNNVTTDGTRLCVEAACERPCASFLLLLLSADPSCSLPTDSQRKIAQKFYPYLDFELAEATRAAASERQLRLLGWHGISNYG